MCGHNDEFRRDESIRGLYALKSTASIAFRTDPLEFFFEHIVLRYCEGFEG